MMLTISLLNQIAFMFFTNEGDVMNKQIVAIFLTLLMIGTIFVITPSDLQVGASGGGEDDGFGLDGDYIEEKTKYLSDIVKNLYEGVELEKGRAFGTIGEHHAANYIADRMGDIGLDDPTLCGGPYLEKIYNIPSKLRGYLPTIPLRGKLIVNSMELKINGVEVEDGEYHIQPQWGDSLLNLTIKNKLTTSIDESNLKVERAPTSYAWFKNFIKNITDFDKFSGDSFISFVLFLLPRFEDYYNFSFSELNESNILDKLPWLNNTDYFPEPAGGGDFVYIRENPQFNPDPIILELPPAYEAFRNICGGQLPLSLVEMILWKVKNKIPDKPQCKGIILYDHNEDNNTYDMNYRPYHPLPTIYITFDDGADIDDNPGDYTIDYSIDQEWDRYVDCYNVIGEIEGTNTDETDIVCCLYDSWWNQGTADAAIGMGIILAIAKYMKQLDDLGMPICKRIVEIHGGNIWVESEGLYKGTTISFSLKNKANDIQNQITFDGDKNARYMWIKKIYHRDKEIFYFDFSHFTDDDYESVLKEITTMIVDGGKKDLVIISDVRDNSFSIESLRNTRRIGKIIKPYLKKSAIIGITKHQEMFLNIIKTISGIEIKAFKSVEEAKDWLVKE